MIDHTPGRLSLGPQSDLMLGPPGHRVLIGELPRAPVGVLSEIVIRYNGYDALLADNKRLRFACGVALEKLETTGEYPAIAGQLRSAIKEGV